MASSGERSDSAGTLPRPELNPLVNPLLAENMGRWAEVYFTSPPEKREEAVLDLLRELEAGGSARAAAPPVDTEPVQATQLFARVEGLEREPERAVQQEMAPCHRCGNLNPVTHQFCGMCGASVTGSNTDYGRVDSPYTQHAGEMENSAPPHVSEPRHTIITEPYAERFADRDEDIRGEEEVRSDPYDLSLFQGLRSREAGDYEYEEPASPPYRYYIGAVLAILLAVLGFMAYRSGQMARDVRQASAPPPAPAETEPAMPSATPQPNTAAPSSGAKTSTPPAAAPTGKVTAERTQATRANPVPASQNPAAFDTAASSPASATEPAFSETSGADDLALAQHYLSGGAGQARDPGEAAKYLWRAMGKHNGPATLMLADLYLRGDGVPKNCDQARVLLDSAARRGMTGAGDRLRNLRAFGCQ